MENKVKIFINKLFACYTIFKNSDYDKNFYIQCFPEFEEDVSSKYIYRFRNSSFMPLRMLSMYLCHPVVHYVFNGVYDGYDLRPDFNSKFYIKNNSDVKGNPYAHYLRIGRKEGRVPTSAFMSVSDLVEVKLGLSTADDILWYLQEKGYILIFDHGQGGGADAYLEKVLLPECTKKNNVAVVTPCYVKRSEKAVLTFYTNNKKKLKVEIDSIVLLMTYHASSIILNNLCGYNKKQMAVIMHYLYYYEGDIDVLFHDFNFICPLDVICRNSSEEGMNYIDNKSVYSKRLINRRKQWQQIFDKSTRIVFFSESSRKIAEHFFSFAGSNVFVEPHKPLIEVNYDQKYEYKSSRPLTIGIVGAKNKIKGIEIVLEMAKKHPGSKFIIIGHVVNAYQKKTLQLNNVEVTGYYEHSQLPELLKKHDVKICALTSLIPETFCYVLQELMMLEYPVVSFNTGAQGERTSKYKYGVVVDDLNAESMFAGAIQLKKRLGTLYDA
jgi:glycosyltransferase involved in cell wall biosynthesis